MASGGIDYRGEGNLPDLNVGVLFQDAVELNGAVFFVIKKPDADDILPGVPKLTVKIEYPDLWCGGVIHFQLDTFHFVEVKSRGVEV